MGKDGKASGINGTKPAANGAEAVTEILATTSLNELQSKEYRHVLDTVDRLRTCGLGTILQLPQLVVCGNQSSGKSSVLEAITGIPLPRKGNLCTRFATEIILRRDLSESIHTKIIPDSARRESENAKLSAFNWTIADFSELPQLIERATDLMGLNVPISDARDRSSTRAFPRDVLSVEIAGPNRPELTLVDLPGLLLSANKDQSEADVKLIHSLVGDYIAEKRTVMLAVISAKDDYANQGILTKCKEVDKDGQRTLGIITKPDYLRTGSANETTWINLAQNNDIYFELGWHMLKNRSEDEIDSSFEARNSSERAFLGSGQYRSLPEDDKGIESLRIKLSKLLFKHLKKELPILQAELNTKHLQTMAALNSLGEKRCTIAEQKRFLMSVATSYQHIVANAVDGHYEHVFFNHVDTFAGVEDLENIRRLRAAVQFLNLQFASQMRQFGHKYCIEGEDDDALPEPYLIDDYAMAEHDQSCQSREDAVDWVKDILVRTRGRELAGNFDPSLISQLFWEQSERWEELATAHVDRIHKLCVAFVKAAINEVVSEDVGVKLLATTLIAAVEQRRKNAGKVLRDLIMDKQRRPMTYDPAYTANVQEARSRKATAKILELMEQADVGVDNQKRTLINARRLASKLKHVTEPDMDRNSSEDALDSSLSYYKAKVQYFITAVTETVVERHLVSDLALDILSPLAINDMSDREVEYLAAEADEVTHKRAHLEGHKAILESGQEAFRQAAGSYK